MRRQFLLLLVTLAGCGQGVKQDEWRRETSNQASAPETGEPGQVDPGTLPVRTGELGPNFSACSLAGTSRQVDGADGDALQVRAAPFDNAAKTGSIPAGARFFICTRSHDQRWLGVVYDAAGTLSPGCGVSRPLPGRRNYEGPCRSGWVSAPFVKQIAG